MASIRALPLRTLDAAPHRLAVLAVLLAAQAASAEPLAPVPCPSGRVCSPTPQGPAPVLTPAIDAQLRARTEQEVRARSTAQANAAAASELFQSRETAFQRRAEDARPDDIPVKTPRVEIGLGARLGFLDGRKDYGHAGPELSLSYRLDTVFAIDLPVSLLQTHTNFGAWPMLGLRPAFKLS